jgi:FK506-binding protein 1
MTEDIQLAPGISKKILRAGDGSEPPKTGDTITVHYHGALEDGSKFDSSYDRDEPFETEIGVGRVIKGWDVGMMTMCPGEKAILTIDGANGYGASGSPPKIPPNATLVFTVELLKINGREALLESDEELMAGALKLKEEATEKFKAQDL